MTISTDYITGMELTDVYVSQHYPAGTTCTAGQASHSATATTAYWGQSYKSCGAVKLSIAPKIDSKDCKGDSITIDIFSKLIQVDIDAEFAVFSLNTLPIYMGGKQITFTATKGATSSDPRTWSFKDASGAVLSTSADYLGHLLTFSDSTKDANGAVYTLSSDASQPPYFRIEGIWKYPGSNTGASEAHVWLPRCTITDAPTIEINDASQSFGTMKCKMSALAILPTIPIESLQNKWMDFILADQSWSVLSY